MRQIVRWKKRRRVALTSSRRRRDPARGAGEIAECVDLAPGLTGVLYFEHLKIYFKTFKKLKKKYTYRQ
jgi:hypothetical protein